jgi:hypothetical protein
MLKYSVQVLNLTRSCFWWLWSLVASCQTCLVFRETCDRWAFPTSFRFRFCGQEILPFETLRRSTAPLFNRIKRFLFTVIFNWTEIWIHWLFWRHKQNCIHSYHCELRSHINETCAHSMVPCPLYKHWFHSHLKRNDNFSQNKKKNSIVVPTIYA